jgi:hypothetical protein
MKTNISVRLIGVIGALIPISVLIRTYFGLPTNGFFGAVLPTIAAVAVMCILIYAFVRERGSK